MISEQSYPSFNHLAMFPPQGVLRILQTYTLSPLGISLKIAKGSVVDFAAEGTSAIVNAANEGCLQGGGVDGAITMAGGPNLRRDRLKFPEIEPGVRCKTGSAVTAGPGEYGGLHVQYVIHAVGPMYHAFHGWEEPDELLRSAYQMSLKECQKHEIEEVGFPLISAGIYRGSRGMKDVLQIGVQSIADWAKEQEPGADSDTIYPKTITLCGFTNQEADLLMLICDSELS